MVVIIISQIRLNLDVLDYLKLKTQFVIKHGHLMILQFKFWHIRDRKCLSIEMFKFLSWLLLVSSWVV